VRRDLNGPRGPEPTTAIDLFIKESNPGDEKRKAFDEEKKTGGRPRKV